MKGGSRSLQAPDDASSMNSSGFSRGVFHFARNPGCLIFGLSRKKTDQA